jgi:hypothetical protein
MTWLNSMLRDGHDGSVSSKRVVTLLAFTMCAVAFMANLFFKYEVLQFMYESMMYIVIAGLGFTASEKFTKKDKTNE